MASVDVIIRTIDQGSNNAVSFAKKLGSAWKDLATPLNQTLELFGKVQDAAAAAIEAIGQGADVAQTRQSFEQLNEELWQTPNLLEQMKEASRGTISEFQLMSGLMTLTAGASDDMSRSYAQAAPQLLEMAKAANKLNPALGSTQFLYESITTGIKRQSPLILDNLGIVLKQGEAYEEYAAELGKTASELTNTEKQYAFLNAAMEAGNTLIEQAGGNVDALGDPLARLNTLLEDTKNNFLAAFAGEVVAGADDIAGSFAGMEDDVAELGRVLGELAVTVLPLVVEGATAAADAIGTLAKSIVFTNQLEELERQGIITAEQAKEATIAYRDLGQDAALAMVEGFEDEWYDSRKELAKNAIKDIREGMIEQASQADDVLIQLVENWRVPTEEARQAGEAIGDSVISGMRNVFQQGEGFDADEYWQLVAKDIASSPSIEPIITAEDMARVIDEREVAAEFAEKANKIATQFWEDYAKALKENAAMTGDLFTEAIRDEDQTFFTDAQYRQIGGRTREEQQDLEALQEAYDDAAQTLHEYRVGIRGFGEEQKDINEAMKEAGDAMAYYDAKMQPLLDSVGSFEVVSEASWNFEALNSSLYDAADAAGASAETLAVLGVVTGEFSEEAAAAALKVAAVQEKIGDLGAAIADGLDPQEAIRQLQDFITEIDKTDFAAQIETAINFEPEFLQGDDIQSALENAFGAAESGRDIEEIITEFFEGDGDITASPVVKFEPAADIGTQLEEFYNGVKRDVYDGVADWFSGEGDAILIEPSIDLRPKIKQDYNFEDEMAAWFNENKDTTIAAGFVTEDISTIVTITPEFEFDESALAEASAKLSEALEGLSPEQRQIVLDAVADEAAVSEALTAIGGMVTAMPEAQRTVNIAGNTEEAERAISILISDHIQPLMSLHPEVTVTANTGAAAGALREIITLINSIPSKKTVEVEVVET